MRFFDILAGLMALILLSAIIGLVFLEREIPEVLTGAFGVAVGFVFRTGVERANGVIERRRNNGSGS